MGWVIVKFLICPVSVSLLFQTKLKERIPALDLRKCLLIYPTEIFKQTQSFTLIDKQ